ncbi:MAG: integrase arm-type DNA-binding domain-containing protein [Dechloromonas sp.]|uniref:tyrosine-type recombinase/integrase n=1 Tax=Dechloromonas sp. TaxID=1917218 RepID=UPI0027E9070F|nr:integrase arm-type DNA-binding domain-containing protein [Dechloromonas sp.]MBT9521918.1 integrase arm-type DNA-binding domain-containing protein [Dechloromonas sp.]
MARKAKELSALEVNRLTAPGLHFVGGVAGLSLQVSASGARSWILRATVGTRRRDIGLGGFPDVTLAGAREAARAARNKIKEGIDPVDESKAKRSALVASQAAAITFGEAAAKFIAAHEAGWKNAKHAAQWTSTLETYAFPTIGKIRVSDVETAHVITILEKIWTTKTETASRLRGRIESVLDWATVRGYRKGENPARWKGHLDMLLPARAKVQKVEHHAALDYREAGAFMAELAKVEGMGARALEFAILTVARSGEVRGATWAEIDEKAGIWTIPAGRMKAEKEHRIPLASTALALLAKLPRIAGTDLIFPNSNEKPSALSDMTLTAVLRRMGRQVTAHGFRSTFRDWAGETTAYPREVIEHALAHQLKDKAEAAYARGTLFDKRRRLMADWAKHCATVATTSSVTAIRSNTAA